MTAELVNSSTRLCILAGVVFGMVGAGTCPPGMSYPSECPRPEDPPSYTKCCRYYFSPACCEERATTICGSRVYGGFSKEQRSFGTDPGSDWLVKYCPQPEDSDDKSVCQFRTTGNTLHIDCISRTLMFIIGFTILGVFVLTAVIITTVCCYMFRSGKWKCVQIRPGKYTIVRVHGSDRTTRTPEVTHAQSNDVILANSNAYPQTGYQTQEMSQQANDMPPPAYEAHTKY